MEYDLPPHAEPINQALLDYLKQMVDNPQQAAMNPKKLLSLVAIFEDEDSRVYSRPGGNALEYPRPLPGEAMITSPQKIMREDLLSATVYVDAAAATCVWMIVNGRHIKVC